MARWSGRAPTGWPPNSRRHPGTAWIDAVTPAQPGHSLLVRRGDDGELAFYRCWSPVPVPLAALVRVAGIRWAVEEGFQTGKGQVGLDYYQVRTWTGWHSFVTLAMLALALLMVCAARGRGLRAWSP